MMKRLKIPESLSETIMRGTDNTMTNRAKRQTMRDKILHRKLKIEHHEPHYNPWMNSGDELLKR
jgi:D-hexose-6-phosphate mutarotase